MTSFWEKHREKGLNKRLQRSIHQARTNIDYQIKHPNEKPASGQIKKEPHADAKKRIQDQQIKILKNSNVPTIVRPKRINKIG